MPPEALRPDRPRAREYAKAILRKVAEQVLVDRKNQISVRAKLLTGALILGTLPLLVASIIVPMLVTSTLTSVARANLTQVASDLAALTQDEMQFQLDTLQSLAKVELLGDTVRQRNAGTLDGRQLEAANRQLRSLIMGLGGKAQGIFVAAADGSVFCGSLKNGVTDVYANLEIRDRDYFRKAAATLKPVISDPLKSKINNVPIIVVAVPFLDAQGNFAGLLGLSVEIEHITQVISSQKFGRTGYPFAIDHNGVILAHPNSARLFQDMDLIPGSEELSAHMQHGETGVLTYHTANGVEKIAAFAPVPIAGWSIAASMETSEFSVAANRVRWIIFALIGACIVAAFLVTATFIVGLEELKQALAEAQASERRFKLFANITQEIVWDWDLATNLVWWNKGLKSDGTFEHGGVLESAEAATGDWLPAEDRDRVRTGLRGCIQRGKWSGEHHYRRSDGTLAYVLHRATVVHGTDGQPVRVIGSMTDITARRTSEEKLLEQAALLDQARDAIQVHDLHQVITYWNQGAERLYGCTAGEAIGRRHGELLQTEPAAFQEAWQQVLTNGEWFGHLKKHSKDGVPLTLDCRWTLLRDEQGQPKSILAIDTDITEREQMEAKFLRAQRLESIGTLAGGIAHDLNNLLSPIVIGVNILKESGVREEDRQILQYIEDSATRGTNLVKQVLSFARGIEGARVAVHLGYVAREVEAIAKSTFPKDIRVRIDIPKDIGLILADPTQINQVLMNLCVNARDAMPGGGQLTVSAKNVQLDQHFSQTNPSVAPGPYVLLEVADTGTGMTKEVLDKLFVPFFTTKATGKGTGLGLSTVIGITRSHGGTVNVYSEIGKGSVFKVFLPVITDPQATPEAMAATEAPPIGNGETILLVDDEALILSVARQALVSYGYTVITASDGAEAFSLYLQYRDKIAVVLTDMMMPTMDGNALISALRRIDARAALIGASGLNDNNNQIKAAEAGISHFLCKPYTTTALLKAIAAALADRVTKPAV